MNKKVRIALMVGAVVLMVLCAFAISKETARIDGDQVEGYYPYPVYPWMYWTPTADAPEDADDVAPTSGCVCPPCCRPAPPRLLPTVFPYPYPIP